MPTKNKYTTVSFKLNEDTKDNANNLFNHLGLTMSSALKLFIHQPYPTWYSFPIKRS